MRKAFIGLSTPLGYDYQNQAKKTSADQSSSPNPVLDSPFGLLILFDRLVFLSRSLCPENMRDLPYVEFLDENGKLPVVTAEEIEIVRTAVYDSYHNQNHVSIHSGITYEDSITGAGVTEKMGVDNHTHGLVIGEFSGMANADEVQLAIDLLFLSRLNDPYLELITNSRLRPQGSIPEDRWGATKLSEIMVVENISNYLTTKGPYHPVIDEVRESKYIEEFRMWITEQEGLASEAEVHEMKNQVERALQDAQDNLFLKHLDQNRHFKSIGEAMLGDLAGLVYPAAGTTKAILESGAEAVRQHSTRWQGFVVDSKRRIRDFNGNT